MVMNHFMRAALCALLLSAPMNVQGSTPRLVFLGDSLTAGYQLNRQSAYPALIQERLRTAGLPWEVLNAGVSGDTSAGALRRADALLRDPIGCLVLWIGGNDGLRGQDTNAMKQNIERILVAAQAKSVPVLLVQMTLPPNFGDAYVKRFSDTYTDLAAKYHVPLLPFMLDQVAGVDELNLADGIHPNARGHKLIAEHMWTALEPHLRELVQRTE